MSRFFLAAALLVLPTIILAVSISTTVEWYWYSSQHARILDLITSSIGFLSIVGFFVYATKKWWRLVVPFSIVFLSFQLFTWHFEFTRILDSHSLSKYMSYTLSWAGFGASGGDFIVIHEVNRRHWPFAKTTKVHSYTGATRGKIIHVGSCNITLAIGRSQSKSETVMLAIPGCETRRQ